VLACLVFCFAGVYAQWVQPFPDGLGIEVGGGHNQLKWHVNASPPFTTASDHPRQEFSFTPIFRLSYQFNPFQLGQLLAFIGYDKFGGKSASDPAGYKDEYWISAVDIGLIGAYRIADFTFGPGLKYNRHIKKTIRSYGLYGQTSQRSWAENDETIFLKDFSYDLGGRISWEILHWSLSGEAWFGITRLEKDQLTGALDIRENHFRILVGYRL
jgi:hypothetical protein